MIARMNVTRLSKLYSVLMPKIWNQLNRKRSLRDSSFASAKLNGFSGSRGSVDLLSLRKDNRYDSAFRKLLNYSSVMKKKESAKNLPLIVLGILIRFRYPIKSRYSPKIVSVRLPNKHHRIHFDSFFSFSDRVSAYNPKLISFFFPL